MPMKLHIKINLAVTMYESHKNDMSAPYYKQRIEEAKIEYEASVQAATIEKAMKEKDGNGPSSIRTNSQYGGYKITFN